MTRVDRLRAVFVAEIPDTLEDGILYVSRECSVALHSCACGCGEEVSTPLGPTEFTLTMHEDGASMRPSIGNHDFACASHYIIQRGAIIWAARMTRAAIDAGRARDRLLKRPPLSAPTPTLPTGLSIRSAIDWVKAVVRRIFGE